MAFLATLGLFAWLVIALVFIVVLTILVEQEEGTVAGLIIAGIILCLYFFGYRNFVMNGLLYAEQHPGTVILAVILYLLIGVVYSFIKWYFYVKDQARNGRSLPTASTHKADLGRWIGYWPFSGIWTLIDEPIKQIVIELTAKYDSLAEKIYASHKK